MATTFDKLSDKATDLWSFVTAPVVAAFDFIDGISTHASQNQIAYLVVGALVIAAGVLAYRIGRKVVSGLMRLPRLIITLASLTTLFTGHSVTERALAARAAADPGNLSVTILPFLFGAIAALGAGFLAKRLLRHSLRGTLSLKGKVIKLRQDYEAKREITKLRAIPTAPMASSSLPPLKVVTKIPDDMSALDRAVAGLVHSAKRDKQLDKAILDKKARKAQY